MRQLLLFFLYTFISKTPATFALYVAHKYAVILKTAIFKLYFIYSYY